MKMTAKFKEFGRGEGEVSQATEHKKKAKEIKVNRRRKCLAEEKKTI